MFIKWLTENLSIRSKRAIKNSKVLLSVALGVTVAVSAGCSLLPKEAEEEELPVINPPKLSEKPTYPVTTQTLETTVRGVGRLMATKEETLYFVDGNLRVKDVYVKSGDPVKAGQLLAELDVTDKENELRSQRLQMRNDELEMIKLMRNTDGKSAEQIEQAKINFELKRQRLVELEQQIERAKLFAPFDGTVVGVYIKKGDSVEAYGEAIVVADLTQLTVAAELSESDLRKVAVGMEVDVDINAAGKFKGKVAQLPNPKKADDNNGGFPGSAPKSDSIDNYLLVSIDPFPEGLQRNTPLSVSVIVDRKENAVVIPLAALRSYSGRNYVQVVDDNGNKREVDVEIGQRTSTVAEIVKGLEPGQKVVGR